MGQVLKTLYGCRAWSISLGREYVIALMPVDRSWVGVVRQDEGSYLGSKVHHCVNVVLGEQVADQVRALNVTLDQLHDVRPIRDISGSQVRCQHLLREAI